MKTFSGQAGFSCHHCIKSLHSLSQCSSCLCYSRKRKNFPSNFQLEISQSSRDCAIVALARFVLFHEWEGCEYERRSTTTNKATRGQICLQLRHVARVCGHWKGYWLYFLVCSTGSEGMAVAAETERDWTVWERGRKPAGMTFFCWGPTYVDDGMTSVLRRHWTTFFLEVDVHRHTYICTYVGLILWLTTYSDCRYRCDVNLRFFLIPLRAKCVKRHLWLTVCVCCLASV